MGVLVCSFSSRPPFCAHTLLQKLKPTLSPLICLLLVRVSCTTSSLCRLWLLIWPTLTVLCLILCGRSLNAVALLEHSAGCSVGSTVYPWPGSRWGSLSGTIFSFIPWGIQLCIKAATFLRVYQSHVKALYSCYSEKWQCSLPSSASYQLQHLFPAPHSTLPRIKCCA